MDKRGGYSDFYCRGLFYSDVVFFVSFLLFCRFSCLLYFPRNKFTLVPKTLAESGIWVFAMQSQTEALQGASVLHMERFRGSCYVSDSLDFHYISLHSAKAEPA